MTNYDFTVCVALACVSLNTDNNNDKNHLVTYYISEHFCLPVFVSHLRAFSEETHIYMP